MVATSIPDLPHIVDEETQPGGRVFRFRWRLPGATRHEIPLVAGVRCYYLHLHNGPECDLHDDPIGA